MLLDRSRVAPRLSSSPLPAAGRRPPPLPPQQMVDDDDCRTIVCDKSKLLKRSSAKSLGSQGLEPARAGESGRRDRLLPGPPPELLLDDSTAFYDITARPRRAFNSLLPSTLHRLDASPRSPAPPVGGRGQPPFDTAPRAPTSALDGRYGSVPSVPISVPGVVMPTAVPAHFMTPQPPYSDPPPTAVTSRRKASRRPAISWAIGLVACGLLVVVAAIAVVRGNDSAADAKASLPPRTIGASPAASPPLAPPDVAAPAPNAPPADTQEAAIDSAAVPASAPALELEEPMEPAPATAAATSRPAVARKPARASAPKPAVRSASLNESPTAKKTTKTAGKGSSAVDDETKKALEALQKAQLESASSFGD